MKIISCNYTGNIPGVGRGPVTNVKISDALYKQLCNMGYNLRLTLSKAEPIEQPKVAVTKAMHVPSLEEKRAATLSASESSTPAKISPLKKATAEEAKVETPKEEPKVEETQPEVKAEEAPKVEEQPAEEAKTFTADNLAEATDEELEALIPADVKRPVRYGRKWLLKTAVNYV